MISAVGLRRRDLFKLGGGAAAAAGIARAAPALGQPAGTPPATAAANSEYVIRGGHVLTMEPGVDDLPGGDVHVRDGTIVAVGPNVDAPRAEVIDGADRIVMPGFVDTHWHLWNTFLRGMIHADDPIEGYFPLTSRVGPYCTPQDAYESVRLSIAEAYRSGITTVHDWAHNIRTPQHADAELQALKDMGVRARFSYGTAQDLPVNAGMDLADLARVQREWARHDGMLGIGAAVRTPGPSRLGVLPVEVVKEDVAGIRKLGLPFTIHGGPKDLIRTLAAAGILGGDLLMVHPQGLTAQERQAIADAKTPYSIAPVIEMSYSAVRSGYIQFAELEQLDVPLSLSVDSSGASANADFFTVMRALLWSNWARSDIKLKLQLNPKRLVELATIEGARRLGVGDKTGSIKVGKRADLITVRRRDVNMVPMNDPCVSLVFSAQPANVDTVMVDGRVVSRNGKLVSIDVDHIIRRSTEAAVALAARVPRE
jgi:5-methylthioadenosine/S-adenosylhomocysteine deaminase